MQKKIITTLLLLFTILTLGEAQEVSINEKITGLYVGYFQRAPDKEGLDFWDSKAINATDTSTIFKELSYGFSQHPLFVSTYAHLNNREFVESIYQNTLGKGGDVEGITYWTNLLDEQGLSRSDMVADFIETSLQVDLSELSLSDEELVVAQQRKKLITNKVYVALKFTTLLEENTNIKNSDSPEDDPAYQASIKIIEEVTDDITTVERSVTLLESIQQESDPIGVINGDVSVEEGGTTDNTDSVDNNSAIDGIPTLSSSDKIAYLDAINDARSQAQDCHSEGLFPATTSLSWSDNLYNASYEHIQDLVATETFSHTGSGTQSDWTGVKVGHPSSMVERIENYSYVWRAVGENIAAGTFTDNATKVVQQWLDSDGHCANLMSPNFTEVGMAMIYKEGSYYTYYWNQNFGTPR